MTSRGFEHSGRPVQPLEGGNRYFVGHRRRCHAVKFHSVSAIFAKFKDLVNLFLRQVNRHVWVIGGMAYNAQSPEVAFMVLPFVMVNMVCMQQVGVF